MTRRYRGKYPTRISAVFTMNIDERRLQCCRTNEGKTYELISTETKRLPKCGDEWFAWQAEHGAIWKKIIDA